MSMAWRPDELPGGRQPPCRSVKTISPSVGCSPWRSYRLHQTSPRQNIIHEPRERVEPHHVRSIGDEVRERIDIVEVHLTIAGIDQILDSTDFDVGCGSDALHRFDD